MRIIFAGTPEFAAAHLSYLLEYTDHEIVAVFTQPDRPAGRGKKLSASPVKEVALGHGIPIFQPTSLKDTAAQKDIENLKSDVMVVVAYGLILPETVLSAPQYGCINVHGSLLPRWRGAAPIQRAIEAGDKGSGITIMQMEKGLDTGDMLLKTSCAINNDETSASLHDKLLALGAVGLVEVLQEINNQKLNPEKQSDKQACYAEKITKAEAQLDWARSAKQLDRQVRAFNPFPISYFNVGKDRVRVWESVCLPESLKEKNIREFGTVIQANKEGIDIATGEGVLRLLKLQFPGKKILSAAEILNGHQEKFPLGRALI